MSVERGKCNKTLDLHTYIFFDCVNEQFREFMLSLRVAQGAVITVRWCEVKEQQDGKVSRKSRVNCLTLKDIIFRKSDTYKGLSMRMSCEATRLEPSVQYGGFLNK